ncbi:MAG: LPS export ABC transporter periplasmic protein LptC [Candidatus Cloacimonetes bacterium]|nr:LPS export ABC transporter periplasmic protein LptC [Candidatus Cloacimonadota bacterium]
MTGKIFLIIILISFIFLASEEQELREYKLINADTLIVKKVAEEYVSNLKGNVHFFYGETEFFADYADIYEQQKIAKMYGNVEVYDDTLSLFADQVDYYRKIEKLFLNGNVFAQETHVDSTIRTFAADSVSYFRELREFHAYENVKSYDEREEIHGTCGKLSYYLEEGYGYLIKEPILSMAGSDTLEISAEKIEYFEDYEKVAANFNVLTRSNDFDMTSDFLLYFSLEEKAIYLGNPRFTSDLADADAIEFQIFFEEQKIKEAILKDSCLVVFKTDEAAEKENWVSSSKMTFDFDDGKIQFCKAEINVKSYFEQDKTESKDFTINNASGQRLIIKMNDDNKIESIDMRKKVQGMYKFEKK